MNGRDVEVRIGCPWCGPVVVQAAAARCALDHSARGGISEMPCPGCERMLFARLTPREARALRDGGARPFEGATPLELLETGSGPAITIDDVIRVVFEMAATPYPQKELTL